MNNKALLVPIIVFCFFAGALIQKFVFQKTLSQQETESEGSESPSLKELEDKIYTLYRTELQDYRKLKTMKEKYETANDILAKIMVIFLADLGLRVSQSEIQQTFSPLAENSDYQANNKNCPPPTTCAKCPTLKEMAKDEGMQMVPQNYKVQGSTKEKKWVKNEEELGKIKNEGDIQEFLKSVAIDNLFEELPNFKTADNNFTKSMEGVFEGSIEFDNPEEQAHQIYLKFENIVTEDTGVRGDYIIKLSKNGEPYSNSNGGGIIQSFKFSSASKKVIFLELGGRTGYFQLYLMNDGSFIGNFYRQQEVAEFNKIGTVKLYRK